MSPIQTAASIAASSVQTSKPHPLGSWHTVAAIFITFFILLLLASGAGLYHLTRQKASLEALSNGRNRIRVVSQANNPHPFGSDAWREHEWAQVPASSRMALRVADLEAQNNLLEQRAEVLEGLNDLLEQQNKHLKQENAGLRYDANAALDPDVLQRVCEEIHRPIRRPDQGH